MASKVGSDGGVTDSAVAAAGDVRAPRERLTRPRVVAAALEIVDRDGLDGLTMRALGHELGVDPMAAYHWFPNKPAILQGVGEAILTEIVLPAADPGVSWLEVARGMGREYRAALLRHPNALPVASTQPVMTPRGFELIERTAAALVAGGLKPGAALEAINTVAAFVIGSAVVEAGVTPGTEPVAQEAIMASYASIGAERFPTMVAAMAEASELLGDDQAQFETAVDAIVRGLQASFRDRGLLS
jgi:TetR/AcrR family transcriptional regulator, tetracycline repressor protein